VSNICFFKIIEIGSEGLPAIICLLNLNSLILIQVPQDLLKFLINEGLIVSRYLIVRDVAEAMYGSQELAQDGPGHGPRE
jgi:hypothetical protein